MVWTFMIRFSGRYPPHHQARGGLYLEDGHQPRHTSLEKIGRCDKWRVVREHNRHITLAPVFLSLFDKSV
jgi:hypothetical protein